MNIDERKLLIIQLNDKTKEWEDITKRVQWFEDSGNACRIKYFGNNTFYWKSWRELKIMTNPIMSFCLVYIKDMKVWGSEYSR